MLTIMLSTIIKSNYRISVYLQNYAKNANTALATALAAQTQNLSPLCLLPSGAEGYKKGSLRQGSQSKDWKQREETREERGQRERGSGPRFTQFSLNKT